MGKKACKFYAMVGGAAHSIDAWIENGKIYTIRGLRPFDSAEISENYFYKTDAGGGAFITDSDAVYLLDEDDDSQYYLLRKGRLYGAVRNDGALIAPVELSEADARALLWPLGRAWL